MDEQNARVLGNADFNFVAVAALGLDVAHVRVVAVEVSSFRNRAFELQAHLVAGLELFQVLGDSDLALRACILRERSACSPSCTAKSL